MGPGGQPCGRGGAAEKGIAGAGRAWFFGEKKKKKETPERFRKLGGVGGHFGVFCVAGFFFLAVVQFSGGCFSVLSQWEKLTLLGGNTTKIREWLKVVILLFPPYSPPKKKRGSSSESPRGTKRGRNLGQRKETKNVARGRSP